ncbi:MAG TPA: thiamine diphosphokinase [Rubrobacter sp.]|nr:thiamine diphosphokinase [Rubrobacter sp.]
MRAAIFLNGSPESSDLLGRVAGCADLIVAADGGARYALEAGVVPHLVVGDMDSLGEDLALEVERLGAALERHPVRKDKMDGQLAVLAARERGATAADLLCAGGGRLDALFAVPHILLAAERIGLRSTVVADRVRMFVVEAGYRTVEGVPREIISIFPLSGPAAGVTLEGMEYPLQNASLEPGDTLGFHNELIGSEATVSVGKGAVLVVHETENPVTGHTDSRALTS